MFQALLFIAALVGLLSIVPLATWAATGRLSDALQAMKGYMVFWGILGAIGLLGAIGGGIAAIMF